ncbi:Biopolymer transport protein ExbD [invertebrate metagenome]|uniref:Biopolymer transport protein ExbD n=1 Tax=invertebrate metagenome TaxID=1711999 RepID=A0A2H9T8H9_9ZZZZ
MKFRRRPQVELSINLTPLIDVVFLLLIFFMVSTSFVKDCQKITVKLPYSSSQEKPENIDKLTITITPEGSYLINGISLPDNQPKTLEQAIKRRTQHNQEIPVMMSADKTTPWQAVVTVMDIAGQLGIVNVGIVTQSATSQPIPEEINQDSTSNR